MCCDVSGAAAVRTDGRRPSVRVGGARVSGAGRRVAAAQVATPAAIAAANAAPLPPPPPPPSPVAASTARTRRHRPRPSRPCPAAVPHPSRLPPAAPPQAPSLSPTAGTTVAASSSPPPPSPPPPPTATAPLAATPPPPSPLPRRRARGSGGAPSHARLALPGALERPARGRPPPHALAHIRAPHGRSPPASPRARRCPKTECCACRWPLVPTIDRAPVSGHHTNYTRPSFSTRA